MREIKPLTKEQQDLVDQNQGLIGSFIRRYPAPRYITHDDYYQEISMGLIIAASTWVRGCSSFSTWSFQQFFGMRSRAIRIYLKPSKHEKQQIGEVSMEDWVESKPEVPREESIGESQKIHLIDEFDSLPPLDRDMISGEESLRNISRRIGVSHTSLQTRKRLLLESLRRKLRPVFSQDWCREEGFFRKGIDLDQIETDLMETGGNGNDCD